MTHLDKAIFRLGYVGNSIIDLKNYLTLTDAQKGGELARNYPELLESVGVEVDPFEDDIETIVESLDDAALETVYKDVSRHSDIMGDPRSPTFLHMDFTQIVKNQWLIHFTDSASDVASSGFQFGMPEPWALGLTTHLNESAKESGGYNFAYLLRDYNKYGSSRGRWKYGKEAVVFRASGVEVYHYGDNEPQVIFDGSTAKDIIPIWHNEEGWTVSNKSTGGAFHASDDLDNVVQWLVNNYNQYKNVLTY